jgi:hypothetical protein
MLARTPADRSDRPTLAAWRREPDGRPRVRMGSRAPIAAMAGIGGALTVIGGLAPWLSFFAGLQPVRGIDGSYGLAVVVLGLLAVVTAGLHLIPGRAATRWLLGGLGFAILAISGYLGITLLTEFSVLAADPLLIARIEPGLGIALLGGSLLGATLFAPEETVTGASPGSTSVWPRCSSSRAASTSCSPQSISPIRPCSASDSWRSASSRSSWRRCS